jgi:hypothetical protein
MIKIIPFALLLACGGSSFRIAKQSYSANTSAALLTTADPSTAGVDVILTGSEQQSTPGDAVALRVTLLWPVATPPPVGKDVSLGGNYKALVAVTCNCSGLIEPVVEPNASGKFHFDSLSATNVKGSFDLSFSGQLPLDSGGVAYDNTSVQAQTSHFATP